MVGSIDGIRRRPAIEHRENVVRRAMLDQLRADMRAAPVNPATLATIEAYLTQQFPATRMKFRSSTNAEDLARVRRAAERSL